MALRSSKYAANMLIPPAELKKFEDAMKTFEGMTVKKRRQKMEQVAKHGLAKTKKRIAQLAPMGKTGSLKKSIENVRAKATGFGSRAGARTGPVIKGKSKKRAFHAHLVELGTKKKKKRIKAGKKPFTFWSFRAKKVLRLDQIHHGSRARPFIRPAWEQTKHEVPKRVRDKMKTILKKLVAEAKSKGA